MTWWGPLPTVCLGHPALTQPAHIALPSDTPSLVVCFAPASQATSTRVSWLITGGGGPARTGFFPKAACPLPLMTECPGPVQQILERGKSTFGGFILVPTQCPCPTCAGCSYRGRHLHQVGAATLTWDKA